MISPPHRNASLKGKRGAALLDVVILTPLLISVTYLVVVFMGIYVRSIVISSGAFLRMRTQVTQKDRAAAERGMKQQINGFVGRYRNIGQAAKGAHVRDGVPRIGSAEVVDRFRYTAPARDTGGLFLAPERKVFRPRHGFRLEVAGQGTQKRTDIELK